MDSSGFVMAIEFRSVTAGPLQNVSVFAPDGALIGLVGEKQSGHTTLLQLAAGLLLPSSGEVHADEPRRYLGPLDSLNLAPVRTLAMEHTLATHDAVVRGRALAGLDRLRQAGTTVLLLSHELPVLRQLCDEVWWMHEGHLQARGDARSVLEQYQRHTARKLQEWSEKLKPPVLTPSFRRGTGAAQVLSVEGLNAQGQPAMTWHAGQACSLRVTVRFPEAVYDPLISFLIRTRMGFDVYGTSTEAEGIRIGPVAAGETVRVLFQFQCDLCPQDYLVTVGSHSPEGLWHDWLEDAVAFSVVDAKTPLGVANLRANVTAERMVAASA